MKPDYQRFFLTELVALIQRKYKFDINDFFFENKFEYIISKPRFNFQIYNAKEIEIYRTIFVIDFLYFKITRFLY
jgi:hypothetical protein